MNATGGPGRDEFMSRFMAAQPSVRAYALSIVRDFHVCEDVLQETAVDGWRRLDTYDPSRPFLGWILGIARHKALDALRRARPSSALPVDLADLLAAEAEALEAETSRRQRVLADCISKLAGGARAVMELRYERGCGVADICRRLGRSYAAVRKTLSRTRAFLVRCAGGQLGAEAP